MKQYRKKRRKEFKLFMSAILQDYINWAVNEPNNNGNKDCAQMSKSSTGIIWNDRSCADMINFICEKPKGMETLTNLLPSRKKT